MTLTPPTKAPIVADQLYVYTDGSCIGNPGPGAWAWVMSLDGKTRFQTYDGFGVNSMTTNNKMELAAVVEAMRFMCKHCSINKITIHTDSQYVANIANGKYKARTNFDEWQEFWQVKKQLDDNHNLHDLQIKYIPRNSHELHVFVDSYARTLARSVKNNNTTFN